MVWWVLFKNSRFDHCPFGAKFPVSHRICVCIVVGVVPMGVAQGAVDVHEDDPADSGASFSMDESGAEGTQLRNRWFPLRPSAVGEDDDDTNHVTHAASTAAHSSNSDRLQNIPHAWSDDDDKQSPPERSQPDGRDGPDLKRTPWIANTYVSTQQAVAPPVQSQDLASGTAASKDSGSDVSVLSQPHSDHNVTPLDIITRSVPPANRGVSLISELKQRHAPQLNSDSDTESPVSKLLGPNFRVVQQVLDRLKQDRLTDSVTDEAEGDAPSDGHSVTEESVKSMSSAGISATSAGSRVYGVDQTSGQPSFETKSRPSVDAGQNYETLSSRLPPSHNEGHAGDRGERLRRLSNSNVAHYLLDSGPSVQNLPPPLLPITYGYLPEQNSRSSIESSLKSSRIAWGEHTTPAPSATDSIQRTANEGLSSSKRASQERDITPRSSIGSSIPTPRAETRLPMSFPRELSNRGVSGEGSPVIPADNLAFRGETRSVVDGTGATPDVDAAAFSSAMERSNEPNRTGRDQGETLQSAGSLHHLRDSDRSASSDDTDDLLTYEPVLEGDRQYLRMQKRVKLPGSKETQSGADGSSDNRVPVWSSRDAQLVDNVARISGKEQSLSTLQSQVGIHGTPSEVDDSHIKSLHWSLGAGTISPISATSLAQVDSKQEKSSTPLGPVSERSSLLANGTLQEQSLEEDETLVQTEDRDVAEFKETKSHSTTDVSSSDEIYRPVLHRDASANKENRPNESVFKTSSYGIYDIRRSSGPGSTNRRRKALGLEANPARQTARQNGPGLVYISGSSTPSSVRDGRGKPLRGVEDTARTSAYRGARLDQDHYEGSLESNEEVLRPRLERDSSVLKSRQAQDFRDQYQDRHLLREERWSQRHQARSVSSKDFRDSYSTSEQRAEPSYNTSDTAKQLPGQYMDKTDPNRSRRSASSGKSRRRYTDDSFAPSSQPSRLEKTTGSRKHTDGKSRHRSRDGTDSYGARATRLDANISKLTSLISKSMDESISSSSQTSAVPASRWSGSKSRKHRMTSSSESSDVSEFFNYAFLEPRLRSSIKHKARLRELLKSVKSRDMSPIVRARDSTTTESNSCVSSNEGGERERNGEREKRLIERDPSSAATQPRRPDAFEVPFFDSSPAELEPKCTCNRSRKGVVQTFPAKTRKIEERGDGGEFWLPRKRDVGVNCPTPVITRSPAVSSDGSLRAQLEDASTQTEEIVSGRKINRKVEEEPVKSRRKAVKSPLRNIEERGVISQPSPKKSDYIYSVDHREAPQYQPRVRMIASQNSPDHGVRTTSDRTSRAQVPAWFHPLTGKPQIEQRSAESQLNTPSRSQTNDELRVDVFEAAVNSSSSLQKLSLQEAFLYAKSKFVKRSQERVAKIEQAAREKDKRKMIAEAVAEEKRIEASKANNSPDIPKIKTRVKGPGKCTLF